MTGHASKFAVDDDDAEKGSWERNHPKFPTQMKLESKGIPQSDSKIESEIEPYVRACSDGAHVWKQYMDRAKVWDDELANVLNGDLDPLLIFAGLFSAILSAFLIEIRKGLQEDLQNATNELLRILIQDQRNLTILPTTSRFEPTASSRWINGLWFCSLIFSLMSALGASIAKGWVTQYSSTGFGTTWRDAAAHHRRFRTMIRFRMKVVVQGLPIFIHIAFFLFAAGLIILLFEDNVGIAGVILTLILAIGFLYLGATLHTSYMQDSPFRTPVSNIIHWVINRYKAGHQTSQSTSPGGFTDENVFKAQALTWLLLESVDSVVIQDTVRAIAGLPAHPGVQDELYHVSVVNILLRGLSECIDTKTDSSDITDAYLYAILRLVQVGPRNSEANDDSVNAAFISTVEGSGALHLSKCYKLQPGFREVALCINARIHLIYDQQEEDILFNTDIPVMLQSIKKPHIRRLLTEIRILSGGTTLDGSRPFLEAIKSNILSIRQDGHRKLEAAVQLQLGDTIQGSVSKYGVGKSFQGIFNISSNVHNGYIEIYSNFCIYKEFRRQICERGGVTQLFDLLMGDDMEQWEHAAMILERFANYEDTWSALTSPSMQEKITKIIHCNDITLYEILRNLLLKFAEHDELRSIIFDTTLLSSILFSHGLINLEIRGASFVTIAKLAFYEDIRPKLVTLGITDLVTDALQDKFKHTLLAAVGLIRELLSYDDIRVRLVTPDFIKTILGMHTDPNWHIQMAMVNLFVELAKHDDTRPQLMILDVMDTIIAMHNHTEWYVKAAVLNIFRELAKHDDVRRQLAAVGDMQTVTAALRHTDSSVRRDALNVVGTLIGYDDALALLLNMDDMKIIIAMLRDDSMYVQEAATNVVVALMKHENVRSLHFTLAETEIEILRDGETIVQKAAANLIKELAKYDETRTQIMAIDGIQAIMTIMQDGSPDTRKAAIDVFGALANYDNTRRLLLTLIDERNLITMLLDNPIPEATMKAIEMLLQDDNVRSMLFELINLQIDISADSQALQTAVINAIAVLANSDNSRAQLVMMNIMPKIIRSLQTSDEFLRRVVIEVIGILVKYDNTRAQLVTLHFIQIIVNVLLYHDSHEALKLLAELIKYDDIHTTLSALPVIHSAVSNLRDTTFNQLAYGDALMMLLGIAEISAADAVIHHIIALLTNQDPLIVRISIPTLSHLAKNESGRKFLCQSFEWTHFTDLLDRHDTRLTALQVLRELATYDEVFEAMRHDSSFISRFIDMLKNQGDDSERWSIGVEGLLILQHF